MYTHEMNKIAMAVLGSVFILFGVNLLAEAIFHEEHPEKPGYAIAATESGGGKEEATADAATLEPVSPLLAAADVKAGETVAKKCVSCHAFEKGAAKKVGPALFGIVQNDIAAASGFAYSAGMKEFAAGKKWTYEDLNGFLANPKKYVKGTAMGFAGVKDVKERANLIAWLRTQSDSPAPLPAK
jgi:cytochrome c